MNLIVTDIRPPEIPDLFFKPGDLIMAYGRPSHLDKKLTTSEEEKPAIHTRRRMKVIGVYPYTIQCIDAKGWVEGFSVGDVYVRRIRKIIDE